MEKGGGDLKLVTCVYFTSGFWSAINAEESERNLKWERSGVGLSTRGARRREEREAEAAITRARANDGVRIAAK